MQRSPDDEEDNLTILEEMINELETMEIATINNTIARINLIKCGVKFNYMVQLTHLMLFLNIIDEGADTHVLGNSWMELFTVNKNTPLTDVVLELLFL